MGKDSRGDIPSSSRDKGKGKERAVTYHSSKGKGKSVVASSSKAKKGDLITSTRQDGSSAADNASFGTGAQYPADTGQSSLVYGVGEKDNGLNPNQINQPSSMPALARDDVNTSYAPYGPSDIATQYTYGSVDPTTYGATSDMRSLAPTFGNMSISGSQSQYTQGANTWQDRPIASSSYPTSNPAAPIPIKYSTNRGISNDRASVPWSNDPQTPRQEGFAGGEGGGSGGGQHGGGNASRADTLSYQRQGNDEHWEPLDAGDYTVHKSKEFVPGRILKIFWFEPPGANSPQDDTTTDGGGTFNGSRMPGKVRRFIIIETRRGHSTVIPISTYGNRGTLKTGCHPDDHSMIYTGPEKPYFIGETITNPKVEMLPVAAEPLVNASRVNYAKKHTIEHNFRVKFIGEISGQTSPDFWRTYNIVNRTCETPVAGPSSSHRHHSSHTSRSSHVKSSSSKKR